MVIDRFVVRNFYNQILGVIETEDNGNKTVRDFYGHILGKYQKSDNTTRDFYGRIIARGDQCSMLINSNNK